MAKNDTGMYIGLGVAGLAAWWLYNNWATVSAAASNLVSNPAANNIVPSNTPMPNTSTSIVPVGLSQTPVAPGTQMAMPTPAQGPGASTNVIVAGPIPAPAMVNPAAMSISSAFPLTTAALAAAPAGAYSAAGLQQWQNTMQTYVNMVANGDNFGPQLVAMGPTYKGSILQLYDQIFSRDVASYLATFQQCKGNWDGNGDCTASGVSGLNTRHYHRRMA